MTAAVTVESITRQNELEHQRRLHEKLRHELGPTICDILDKSTKPTSRVTDIHVNADGAVWVQAGGEYSQVGTLDARRAMSAIATIATLRDTVVTAQSPDLHTKLPFWGARFAGCIPPMSAAPVFSIRIQSLYIMTLAEFVEQGILSEEHRHVLEDAIRHRKNILVVGEMGGGKTTFANALMDGIARLRPNARLIVIEDTPELQIKVANHLCLYSSLDVTMEDCLRAALRHNGDSIVVGEVRGREALTMIAGWGTGHNGGVATTHAKNAREGLSRIEHLAGGPRQASRVGSVIDVVVAIGKVPGGGRKVREVGRVRGYEDGRYQLDLV
jgi:type IV secretion system protein VirB11